MLNLSKSDEAFSRAVRRLSGGMNFFGRPRLAHLILLLLIVPIGVRAEPDMTMPSTSTPAINTTEKAIAITATEARVAWSKKWMLKYVNVTPRADYVHVLIDSETIHQSLEGQGNHGAVARTAYDLVHSFRFTENVPDTVKLDVVYFENRDNYGAPLWDSIKRIGHLEFSRKALALVSPDLFLKPDTEWKGSFHSVLFYY